MIAPLRTCGVEVRETWDHLGTRASVALIGNPGLPRHLPLQRHLRDAMCSRIHTPQDDKIVADVGRRALARENA